jgi:guanosine-3',5'-bis(diphosphate) 3'-pyrophosphohydrolase
MYAPLVHTPTALIDSIATVNTQLYGQLVRQPRPDAELWQVRRAYDLAVSLYAAIHQADGRPFSAHVVSAASVLTLLGASTTLVATALIHNVYGNADFGDGLHAAATPARREHVRHAVGAEIEAWVYRFRELRLTDDVASVKRNLGALDARDRQLLLLELADLMDKYADLSVLYFGDGRWVTDFVDANESHLIEIGHALGQPVLAEALRIAFATVRASRVPDAFRAPADRKYLYTIVPGSCRVVTPTPTLERRIKNSAPWRFARRLVRGAPGGIGSFPK